MTVYDYLEKAGFFLSVYSDEWINREFVSFTNELIRREPGNVIRHLKTNYLKDKDSEYIDLSDFLNEETEKALDRNPMFWLKPACECGGDKAKTTHALYCPKYKKHK
jgi:hypothetical protein